MWVGMINPTFFSLKGRCYGNQILERIGNNWHAPPSFCVLAFHNGWEDRNVDAPINTDDEPSTSDKNLANFGPVNPEFCRRVWAGRATRWTLPRISNVVSAVQVMTQFAVYRSTPTVGPTTTPQLQVGD